MADETRHQGLSEKIKQKVHTIFISSKNSDVILHRLASLKIRFTDAGLEDVIKKLLDVGKLLWGGQETIAEVLMNIPDRMNPPFNDMLRMAYTVNLKKWINIKFTQAVEDHTGMLLDIVKELHSQAYFDRLEIVDLMDGVACYVKSRPYMLQNLLMFVEAFRGIFAPKKISRASRSKLMEIAKVLRDLLEAEDATEETREAVKKNLRNNPR